MNNPIPKYEIDQEVWFGGIDRQYNGYITSIHLTTNTIGLQAYPLISYSVDICGGADKQLVLKEEIYLYSKREELLKDIDSQAKKLGVQLGKFRKGTGTV